MIRTFFIALSLLLAGCSYEQSDRSNRVGTVRAHTGDPAAKAKARVFTPRPSSFANLPDRGQLLAYPTANPGVQAMGRAQNVVRDGAYTWHRAELSEAHALRAIADGELTVVTPSGEQLEFQYDRHVEHASGDWTWVGHLKGGQPSDQIVLTFGEHAAFGNIAQPGKEPLRLTVRNGASWLVETDAAALGKSNTPMTKPHRPDFLIPPKTVQARRSGPGTAAMHAEASTPATNVVDVVLGYTDGFAAGFGGSSQAVTRLNNLVMITNQAYVNSQVVAQVRLVGTVQVSYVDATNNQTALEELSGYRNGHAITVPAALQVLRDARETYGADLVSLVRKFNDPENQSCGIAWLIGGGLTPIDPADVTFGFSVVSDGSDGGFFCRDETLAHELGHNMGSQHDRVTATTDGVLSYGAFPYSFGYKTGVGTGNFYTIMAYGESGQARYRVFSNPRTTFCGGLACGVTDSEDNARSLTQTIPIVSTFHATVVPLPPSRATRNDVDADGKSDLILHSSSTNQTAYWIMNGAVPTRYSPGFTEPAGYTRVASGDFNGDGKLDFVWERNSDRNLVMWIGDGTGYTQVNVGNHAAGWQVFGAGDVDGDGKSDLLLRNGSSAATAYWIMDGAVPTRYSPVFFEPSGFARVATGDFNGDNKLDLVFARTTDRSLVMWTGDDTGYTQFSIGTYADGWEVVESGDIDGDGKSDLLLRNSAAGATAYWIMNGSTPTRYSPAFGEPAGYTRVAVGDLNGDGKLDLVWERSSDRHLLLWQGDGTGFNSLSIGNHAVGWAIASDTPPPVRFVRGDIDADGKSDLLLTNAGAGWSAYWIMNGATPVRYSQAFVQPTGYVRVATGDFNGDGVLDMVWARSSDRSLLMWQGDGTSFTQLAIGNYAAGWQVVDAGDIDKDGKSDLVLENPGFGYVAYWIMNGPVPVRYSAAFADPTGYARVATGDFNGDGKLDLAWSRDSDRNIVMWLGDGSGFSQSSVGAAAAGWAVVGAGDVDGDGRTDLLLRHAGAGVVAYWVMNGPVVARYSGVFAEPAGYALVATGDYNGDGKLDLTWVRDSDHQVLQWQGDGDGFTAVPVRTHADGWALTQP